MRVQQLSNRNLIFIFLIALFSIGIMTACTSLVPASIPPQLSHTPGHPIIITDNRIDGEWFSLEYPDGWRVITNVAIEPLHLIFVSPDDEMLIHVHDMGNACTSTEITPEPDTYLREECLSHNEHHLYISGTSPIEFQAIYNPLFDAVVNSVTFR